MSRTATHSAVSTPLRGLGEPLRVAFVGPMVWLDGCAPPGAANGLTPARFPLASGGGPDALADEIAAFAPDVTVVFDPPALPAGLLSALPGLTLGVLVAGLPARAQAPALDGLDRLVCFDPSLTGERVGRHEVWRAIPPPVSDILFADAPPTRTAPRAISIGRSTEHREAMLMPAKHHHDLLHVVHGVSGSRLGELLGECDVGVYVPREIGGGFGLQVGIHLASAQLLLAAELKPLHGLERNIDYLHFHTPDELAWVLDRLGRFPEMHARVRVRGRLKAEQYRASRLFGRLMHDLRRDVAAFGGGGSRGAGVTPCHA